MTAGDGRGELPAFQLEVARLFFSLAASRGFLLAGGAALLAQHLTARPTEDLDFFTAPDRGHVPAARDALEAAARQRGWSTEQIHDSDTFCRLVVRNADAAVLVDLAVNAPPDLPASETPPGPTLAPEELAGHMCSRTTASSCSNRSTRRLTCRTPGGKAASSRSYRSGRSSPMNPPA